VKFFLNKWRSVNVLLSIWIVGILVSIPFLFMVTNLSPNQCTFKITKFNLIYVFALNLMFIFLPTFGLTILYVYIIVNTKRRYNSLIKIFSFRKAPKASLRSKLLEKKDSLDSNRSNKIINNNLPNRKESIVISFSKNKQNSHLLFNDNIH
jgi:hypothetical protein